MNVRASIPADELVHLYLDERWTTTELAARYECSEATIRRRLDDLPVKTRSRGPQHGNKLANPEWSASLGYVVGLIATDGNLSPDARHISINSQDYELLETVKQCLGLENKIGRERRFLNFYYRLQWGDVAFYDWLMSIGIMPAKSLKLGALEIPDEYLADCVRGIVDGDGSIQLYTDRSNTWKKQEYIYERLAVTIASASRPFLEWLHERIKTQIPVQGAILDRTNPFGHNPFWNLKFAKQDSILLLNWMYYAPALPCLERKYRKASKFLGS